MLGEELEKGICLSGGAQRILPGVILVTGAAAERRCRAISMLAALRAVLRPVWRKIGVQVPEDTIDPTVKKGPSRQAASKDSTWAGFGPIYPQSSGLRNWKSS